MDAAFDPTIAAIFRVARDYGTGLGGIQDAADWPWDWIELAALLRIIDNTYERAAMAKAPLPPREIVFDKVYLDEWIETKAEKKDA